MAGEFLEEDMGGFDDLESFRRETGIPQNEVDDNQAWQLIAESNKQQITNAERERNRIADEKKRLENANYEALNRANRLESTLINERNENQRTNHLKKIIDPFNQFQDDLSTYMLKERLKNQVKNELKEEEAEKRKWRNIERNMNKPRRMRAKSKKAKSKTRTKSKSKKKSKK